MMQAALLPAPLPTTALQIILYVCVGVWLINWRHFLAFKTYPGSWIPDPSTVQFSLAKATFYFKVEQLGL